MDNYGIIANPFYFNSANPPPKKNVTTFTNYTYTMMYDDEADPLHRALRIIDLSIEPIVSLTWDSFPSNSSEMKRFDRWNLVSKAVFEGKHILANMSTVVILAKTAR
jgi:hypothetical protein